MEYGLSSEMPNDHRQELWKQQREERGFDSTEIWNLDVTIAKFIVPRLKVFKVSQHGSPGSLEFDKWLEVLDKMIASFEWLLDEKNFNTSKPDSVGEGLHLFAEYYSSLWT